MKITSQQLRRIIKEEVSKTLREVEVDDRTYAKSEPDYNLVGGSSVALISNVVEALEDKFSSSDIANIISMICSLEDSKISSVISMVHKARDAGQGQQYEQVLEGLG